MAWLGGPTRPGERHVCASEMTQYEGAGESGGERGEKMMVMVVKKKKKTTEQDWND